MSKAKVINSLFSVLTTLTFFIPLQTAKAADLPGAGITIAVIDFAGFDYQAPELKDAIVGEVCTDSLVAFDHSNNHISHCPGYKEVVEGTGVATVEYSASGDLPFSDSGHGTAVASVIAGKTIGVAPGVKIVQIRALHGLVLAFDWLHANAQKYDISAVVMSSGVLIPEGAREFRPCKEATR